MFDYLTVVPREGGGPSIPEAPDAHRNVSAYWIPLRLTTQVQHLLKVLSRWDNVMASSALKSALRYTACMQAVYLKTKLRLHLAGHGRR